MELTRRVALAAQFSPGWGAGGGGRRRPALRLLGLLGLLGPQGHRTVGSEGAHVRGDLCVVFGGGCACVTWTQECACVCEGCALEEWSVV